MKNLLFIPICVALLSSSLCGQIVISGDPGTTGASVTIENDIAVSFTTSGNAAYLVFQDMVSTNDGTESDLGNTPTPQFQFNINGGSTITRAIYQFTDNPVPASGDVSATDSLFLINSFFGSSGQTINVLAGTYTFGATVANFNSEALGTFTGNIFFADSSYNRLSDITAVSAVPEPSNYALLLGVFSMVPLIVRRRRAFTTAKSHS